MVEESSWDLYVPGLKLSWSFAFTDDDMKVFIGLSKDESPLHTDTKFAEKMNFKSPILHGVLLATQLSRLIGKELPDSSAMTVGFNIEFVNAVYANEDMLFEAILTRKSESTKLITFKFKIKRSATIISRGEISAKWLSATKLTA